jgi:cytochrome oxidase Cu insertion factor (SCO1/SenC/PrrC family)
MKTGKTVASALLLAFSIVFLAADHVCASGVGDQAPDFELDSTKGGKVKLSNLKGKTVLLNFYNFDFSAT